jgi:hypothetical protein
MKQFLKDLTIGLAYGLPLTLGFILLCQVLGCP